MRKDHDEMQNSSDILSLIQAFDSRVLSVDRTTVREATPPEGSVGSSRGSALEGEQAALVAAVSAAALAAAKPNSQGLLRERKEEVDGAATAAAEAVLQASKLPFFVVAGEGQRDDSPGAQSGQSFGAASSAAERIDSIFDYVDGTTLAALGKPGALSLGATGRDLRLVPDLSAYAVVAQNHALMNLDIISHPDDHLDEALRSIGAATGKRVSDLIVFTHSSGEKRMHESLVSKLRDSVDFVISQEIVTIEPPHLLSLAGLSSPRIDMMIGEIGLTELAFAAVLLDLVSPDFGFVFRAGSIAIPRREADDVTLAPLFKFTKEEVETLSKYDFQPHKQYLNTDLVPRGAAVAAAIFAVTDDPVLRLDGAQIPPAGRTNGFLLEAGGAISKLAVSYK